MKRYRMANLIFAGAFFLFCFAAVLHVCRKNEGTALFYFLAQSCFIGCVADWFAVEAIFRNSLHLPRFRPLIPKNKERIVRQIHETVNRNLIKSEMFAAMIQKFSLTTFLENEYRSGNGAVRQFEKTAAFYTGRFLAGFAADHRKEVGLWARQGGRTFVNRFVRYLEDKALSDEKKEQILFQILGAAEERIKDPSLQTKLARYLRTWGDKQDKGFWGNMLYPLAGYMGIIDYEDMAAAVLKATEEKIQSWKEKDNPFGQTLLAEWSHAVETFMETPAVKKALRDFAFYLYESFPVEEKADAVFEQLWEEWADGDAFENHLLPRIEQAFHRALRSVADNEKIRRQMDWGAKNLLMEILRFERNHISEAIARILESYRTEELNEFIESKVHKELEGIRINGAAVGLAAGAVLYIFIQFIYLPAVTLLFRL